MDAGIIVAIVTGAFGLTTLIVQKLFDISCTKNENEDGSVKSFHCIPRCKNLIYPIPKENIECILTRYREPPNNWGFSTSCKYTKKITNTNNYLVIMPKQPENNNVIWYKEFSKKSDTKIWFLEADLDYIKNRKSVKLFIRRFYVKDNNWHLLYNNSEYISACNGRNSFEANSYIGDILVENTVVFDDDGNAKKEKKKYLCTHEQIGLIIYSKTDNDIITPVIGYCPNKTHMVLLNNKIKETAQNCDFNNDIINSIELCSTSTCRINSVYVGDISLYVCDNNTLLS